MNVMILSPGRRVELIEIFRQRLASTGGTVYTLDMSPYAPALYEGERHFCIKKDFDNLDNYMREIISICLDNNVGLVLTLIDPELSLLARYRKDFNENGIRVVISNQELIDVTLDKLEFYRFFKNKIPVLPTTDDPEVVREYVNNESYDYPVFAKLRKGSASEGICILSNEAELETFQPRESYVYQPYCQGKEYGVDAYFDLNTCEFKHIFIKEKIAMRAGETDKAVSVHVNEIKNIVDGLSGIGFRGPIDIDVFRNVDGKYYVNEINPRFGGSYYHAYQCGMDYVSALIRDAMEERNEEPMDSYPDGVVMMKYNNFCFKNTGEMADGRIN